jgi:hypothetical protein
MQKVANRDVRVWLAAIAAIARAGGGLSFVGRYYSDAKSCES